MFTESRGEGMHQMMVREVGENDGLAFLSLGLDYFFGVVAGGNVNGVIDSLRIGDGTKPMGASAGFGGCPGAGFVFRRP